MDYIINGITNLIQGDDKKQTNLMCSTSSSTIAFEMMEEHAKQIKQQEQNKFDFGFKKSNHIDTTQEETKQ